MYLSFSVSDFHTFKAARNTWETVEREKERFIILTQLLHQWIVTCSARLRRSEKEVKTGWVVGCLSLSILRFLSLRSCKGRSLSDRYSMTLQWRVHALELDKAPLFGNMKHNLAHTWMESNRYIKESLFTLTSCKILFIKVKVSSVKSSWPLQK